jgi:FAD/FMN-containing dehydrogenase
MNELKIKGTVLRKADPGFDQAIQATLFNKRDQGRKPEIMVVPADVDDAIAAIRYAKSAGLRVSVCSGGHSWSANHLRPGGMLLNMKGFDQYKIDRETMTATAGPGCGGSVLLTELMKNGLFFPAGHCKGVCIGGYLLQGGFAWNGRKLGMACESVVGLDIVTADGELVHAPVRPKTPICTGQRAARGRVFSGWSSGFI